MTFEDFSDRADVLRLINMLAIDELSVSGLRQHGVCPAAVADQDVAIGALRVRFDDQAELFTQDDDGTPAIVIVPPSDNPTDDVVAFDPSTPERFACFTGRMFALGDHRIDNPASYFAVGALPLYRTPLDWLRAECQGVCLVDRRPAAIRARLAAVARVIVGDFEHGRELRDAFGRSQQRPKIIVPSDRRAAA